MLKYSLPKFIVISFLLINSVVSGIVELTMVIGYNKVYSSKICMGQYSEQCFDLIPDFSSPYTWVNSNKCEFIPLPKFESDKSSTFHPIEVRKTRKIDNYEIEGIIGEDTLSFPQFDLRKVKFLLVDQYTNDPIKGKYIEGMLGLGFAHSSEEGYSFIDLLVKQGVIKERIFTYEYQNENTARMKFGVVPKKVIDDYTHFGTCNLGIKEYDFDEEWSKINHTNEYDIHYKYTKPIWECTPFSIYLEDNNGNKEIYDSPNNIESLYIDINEDGTIVPFSFLFFLESTLFKKAIAKGDCSFYKNKENDYYSFKCVADNPELDFTYINIEFEKWKIHLDLNDENLFYSYSNEKRFNFYSRPDEKQWRIGNSIAKYFIVIYDMDNQIIGLYNKTSIIYANAEDAEKSKYRTKLPDFVDPNKYKTIKKIGFVVFIIIMLFGIVLIFRFIRRKMQVNKMKDIESYVKMEK